MIDAIKRNHANLHQRTLPNLFAKLSDAQMRTQPHPGTNSIAWNIWHLLRIEDITLNRFVALTPQVYTSGDWQTRLGIPYGDMGTAMAIGDVTTSTSLSWPITPPQWVRRAPRRCRASIWHWSGKNAPRRICGRSLPASRCVSPRLLRGW